MDYVLRRDTRELTDEQLLKDLRRAARALGKKTLTHREYLDHGGCTNIAFIRRFGSWNKALAAAGLKVRHRWRIPDRELFENLERLWKALGRQPTCGDVRPPISTCLLNAYYRRFGAWRAALKAFVAWANDANRPAAATAPRQAAPRKTPRFPNLRLRYDVLVRDSFKCTLCGASPATHPGANLQVDHIIPWSRGGPTTLENLATLCEKCNLGKSNSLPHHLLTRSRRRAIIRRRVQVVPHEKGRR